MVFLHISFAAREAEADLQKVEHRVKSLIDLRLNELKQICYKRFKPDCAIKTDPHEQKDDPNDESESPTAAVALSPIEVIDKEEDSNDESDEVVSISPMEVIDEEEDSNDESDEVVSLSPIEVIGEEKDSDDESDEGESPTADVSLSPMVVIDKEDASSFQNVCERLSDLELLFDITRLSCLSALTVSIESDDQKYYPFLEPSEYEALSVSKLEWWERPYWAWTCNEIALSQAALFAADLFRAVEDSSLSMTVATNAVVARLPFLTSKLSALVVIDHVEDHEFVKNHVKPIQEATQGTFKVDVDWLMQNYLADKDKEIIYMEAIKLLLQPENDSTNQENDSKNKEIRITESDRTDQQAEEEANVVTPQLLDISKKSNDSKNEEIRITESDRTDQQAEEEGNVVTPQLSRQSVDVSKQSNEENDSKEEEIRMTESVRTDQRAEEVANVVTPQLSRQSVDVSKQSNDSKNEEIRIMESDRTDQRAEEEANVVTPQLSRQSVDLSEKSNDHIYDMSPTPPRSPQIDSRGIDLTVLSQLPISIRSEARLAFLMSDHARSTQDKKGTLHKWMAEASSIQKVPRVSLSPTKKAQKRKRRNIGIESFFQPKRNDQYSDYL